MDWKNRITGYGTMEAGEFLANADNWRIHPRPQQEALSGVLEEVGWVQDVIVNLRTSPEWGDKRGVETLVDGHLRVTLALRQGEGTAVPYKYVDLTPHEEALVLSLLDPIGAMAATDKDKLDTLVHQVQSDNVKVQETLERLAIQQGLIAPVDFEQAWQGMPEFEQPEAKAAKSLVVHFQSLDDIPDFAERMGQSVTEHTKYIWFLFKQDESIKDFRWTDAA